MRNKIFASLGVALKLVLSKLSRLIRRGEDNGGNIVNQQRPQIVQVQREIEEESDEGNVEGGVESSDDDSGFSGTQRKENRSTVLRGGSRERDSQPSTSSTSPRNYQMLLQQERDKQLCVVCQDNEKNTILFPCKHLCVCSECVEQITSAVNLDRRRCPICRGKINSYMDVFT
ncbi:E3 ubiquitin-protein ligase RNF26 [Holothuria leucospilota]|uniref:E3 ubiquitin-protein ligase RNF26 n=1 Tax=Holothuria leucospilota TaxID=206669 RepID=A0A9Q1C508_HOLLE|nr:E3 ubiquitin-protein ligase RNF26 [Holothuria leucospilota]